MTIFNFSAGPAAQEPQVLKAMQKELLNYRDKGYSLLEVSHRGAAYQAVHQEAKNLLREVYEVPEEFDILFLAGGATLQFAMVPLNFFTQGGQIDFLLSGAWAKKALNDAQKIGKTKLIFNGEEHNWQQLAPVQELQFNKDAAYAHMTSNETIDGLQWQQWPCCQVPLVVDMSSDILSRRIPWHNFDLIYAGAQKNLGVAGLCVVIIRKDLLSRCPDNLPAYLNYNNHAKLNSLYNTPPSFAIHFLNLHLQWFKEQGGLHYFEKNNQRKAELLYQTIDAYPNIYRNTIVRGYRSQMNVIFNCDTVEREQLFLQQAAQEGFIGLQGHRSRGGMRASLYNAVSFDAVEALATFMKNFAQKSS